MTRKHLQKPIRDEQIYLSPRQTARVMGVSEYVVYASLHDGSIPHRRLQTRFLIPRAWVEGHGTGGEAS